MEKELVYPIETDSAFEDGLTINLQSVVNSQNVIGMDKQRRGKGTVGLEPRNGRLRLRLPRELYGGVQKHLSLGLSDCPENRKVAEAKIKEMESDIAWNRFDLSLSKYRPDYLRAVGSSNGLTLATLWNRFVAYKKASWKATTIIKLESTYSKTIARLEDLKPEDALLVKERLEGLTTLAQTKRILQYLCAACKWGLKNGLIISNPFEGMASDMPKFNYEDNPSPNAFSKEEMDKVLAAFYSHEGNFNGRGTTGYSYKHYAPFVEFLFRTGCRPSEAVGLRWENVAPDCSAIHFVESIVAAANGKAVHIKKSKNNRTRKFPCSERLRKLLLSIRPSSFDSETLVFPSPKGVPINYRNFARRAWDSVVNPLKPNTTPYSCRDTFITLQIIAGMPETAIAKWTDTSVDMIEKYYADVLKLESIRPID